VIAHRIQRKSATDKFSRLGCYVLDLKNLNDPKVFERMAAYITDAEHEGERVFSSQIMNCASDEMYDAIREIEDTQAMNLRSKNDKTYHLVVSFPQGERPELKVLREIEASLCEAIGLGDHQRISAIHDDTEHLHIHIAINKVHPESYRNVEPHYDLRKLMARCVELEVTHGLQPDNHGVDREMKGRVPGNVTLDKKMEAHSGRESFRTWVGENVAAELGQVAKSAESWAALHANATALGVAIKPRGAGLIVAPLGGPGGVKASDVSPELAYKALTGRLGPYEAPEAEHSRVAPEKRYEGKPRQDTTRSAEFFARYKADRAILEATRSVAVAKNASDHEQFSAKLKLHHAERRNALRKAQNVRGPAKKQAYQDLADDRQKNWAKNADLRRKQREQIIAKHPLPNWQTWLEAKAKEGDVQALEALRSRARAQSAFSERVLRSTDPEKAKAVIFGHRQPETRKNGDVHYRIKDGGIVIDKTHEIRAEKISPGAAMLSVILAKERFGDAGVIVNGDATYQKAVLDAAVLHRVDLRFADPALEAARKAGSAANEPAPTRPLGPGVAPAEAITITRPGLATFKTAKGSEYVVELKAASIEQGAAEFAKARNALRGKVADIPPHRVWERKDTGEMVYQGNRTLPGGGEAVLLLNQGEMLIKPVTPAQAAKVAVHHKVGSAITLDGLGRFVGRERERAGLER
jgi:hypothetical protein